MIRIQHSPHSFAWLPRFLGRDPSRRIWNVVLLAPLVCAAGCGKSDQISTASVVGTVTFQGKPVAHAVVFFIGEKGPLAQGETNDLGKFTLMTYRPGDGAIPGPFKVTITKSVPDPAAPKNDGTTPAQTDTMNLLPGRYSDVNQSKLSANVEAGKKNDFKFELTE